MSDETQVEATTAPEPQVEVEAPTPEPEASAPEPEANAEVSAEPDQSVDRYQSLMKSLGEIPDEPSAQLIDSIDEKTIEQLPDSVKGLMKHMMAQQKVEHQKRIAELDKRASKITERSQRVNQEAKDLLQKRYELNRVLTDPKFQQYLKAAQVDESEMEDPFTPAGIKQRIDKGVAEAMESFQRPIIEAAERSRQIAKYQNFVDANPMMKDASFKKQVRTVMENRRDDGNPISLEDAYAMVDRERLIRAEESRKQKEMAARARSNKKISRATVSSSKSDKEPVPNWVTEKGYKGKRSHAARIQYLKDHPEKLKMLRDQQKRGLR